MAAIGSINIGFVGWNPFQFLHYRPVIGSLPGSTLIVEERLSACESVDPAALGLGSVPVLRLPRRRMAAIDGEFDVLVCQTPFAGLEDIRKSRIAMLQYGYAKEAHNFGPWRALGDVCLTFGDYASRKMEPFCPCVATGNPRYEGWDASLFRQAAALKYGHLLDSSRKTVLYAPTWGELSSHGQFENAILALAGEYNVIIKTHHNTKRESAALAGRPHVMVCGAMDDIVELLALSDALISDFSGAIFDAIYCRVPIVLLDPMGVEEAANSRSDAYSIERTRRSEIGVVVKPGGDVAAAVRKALDTAEERAASLSGLRESLFVDAGESSARVRAALEQAAAGVFQAGQTQSYIKNEMRAYFRCKNQFSVLRRILAFGRRPKSGN